MVILAPVPGVVMPPGDLSNDQFPIAGKPLKATLPDGLLQVGWVMAPALGAAGVEG